MNHIILTPDLLLESTNNGNGGPYHSGHVIWDGNQQKFKVLDVNGSLQDFYSSNTTIQAGHRLKEVVAWVEEKRREELELKELCSRYPNLEEARREFEVLHQMLKEPQ